MADLVKEVIDIPVSAAVGVYATGASVVHGVGMNLDMYWQRTDPYPMLVRAFNGAETDARVHLRGPAMITAGAALGAADICTLPINIIKYCGSDVIGYVRKVVGGSFPEETDFYPRGEPGLFKELLDFPVRALDITRSSKKAIMYSVNGNIRRRYDPGNDPLVSLPKQFSAADTFAKRRLKGPALGAVGAVQTAADGATTVVRIGIDLVQKLKESQRAANGRIPTEADYTPAFATGPVIDAEYRVLEHEE